VFIFIIIDTFTNICVNHTYTYTYTHTHAYIHAYIYTYIRTYIHTHTNTNTNIGMHTYTYTYIHTQHNARVRVLKEISLTQLPEMLNNNITPLCSRVLMKTFSLKWLIILSETIYYLYMFYIIITLFVLHMYESIHYRYPSLK